MTRRRSNHRRPFRLLVGTLGLAGMLAGTAFPVLAADPAPTTTGSTISGTITAAGLGAPGISVRVYASSMVRRMDYDPVASAITDADGSFTTTPGLSSGHWMIRFDGNERYEIAGWWNRRVNLGISRLVSTSMASTRGSASTPLRFRSRRSQERWRPRAAGR